MRYPAKAGVQSRTLDCSFKLRSHLNHDVCWTRYKSGNARRSKTEQVDGEMTAYLFNLRRSHFIGADWKTAGFSPPAFK